MEPTKRTCCICDREISKEYLDFLKKSAAIPTYIDVCKEHSHLRHSFDMKKAPGENWEYLKHLRVEYGNESSIG